MKNKTTKSNFSSIVNLEEDYFWDNESGEYIYIGEDEDSPDYYEEISKHNPYEE